MFQGKGVPILEGPHSHVTLAHAQQSIAHRIHVIPFLVTMKGGKIASVYYTTIISIGAYVIVYCLAEECMHDEQ